MEISLGTSFVRLNLNRFLAHCWPSCAENYIANG